MSSLLERLRRRKDDRGMMANLRCVLIKGKEHRSWPVLYRIGVAIDDDKAAFVAGLFATHPEESPAKNFGVTCKEIEQRRGETKTGDNKLTPTERRFQHLLSAEPGDEVKQRVLRMVIMAKSQGVGVNYEKLLLALRYWNERTKTEWAAAYWAPNAKPVDKEVL